MLPVNFMYGRGGVIHSQLLELKIRAYAVGKAKIVDSACL